MTLLRSITLSEKGLLTSYSHMPELIINGATHSNWYYGVRQRGELSEEAQKALDDIEVLLKQLIGGFVSFSNFTEKGQLRFQYMWSPLFQGVGYLPIDELEYQEDAS